MLRHPHFLSITVHAEKKKKKKKKKTHGFEAILFVPLLVKQVTLVIVEFH